MAGCPCTTSSTSTAASYGRASIGSWPIRSGLATTRGCGSCRGPRAGPTRWLPVGAAAPGSRAVTALLVAVWLLLDFPWGLLAFVAIVTLANSRKNQSIGPVLRHVDHKSRL